MASDDIDLERATAELRAREPIFHRPELGTRRVDFERMMAPEFREVGASGRPYDRELVLRTLEERHAAPFDDPWEVREFVCQRLDVRLYLATYLLLQGERRSRRATLWRREDEGWKIVYHQGTLASP
jgi:hypothetical protein